MIKLKANRSCFGVSSYNNYNELIILYRDYNCFFEFHERYLAERHVSTPENKMEESMGQEHGRKQETWTQIEEDSLSFYFYTC